MDTKYEREIDLKDLFLNLLKHWKLIVFSALIIALLAGSYKFVSLRPRMNNAAEYEAQYQAELSDYEQNCAQLDDSIRILSESIRSRQEYNATSPLMTIDPLNEWCGSFILYIDPDEKGPETAASITGSRLAAAYYAYLTGGELYNELSEKTSIADETRFLSDLINVNLDTASYTLTISCIGRSESDIRELLDLVKSGMTQKQLFFSESLGKHDLKFIDGTISVTSDQDLKNLQTANSESISSAKESLDELKDGLSELTSSAPSRNFGASYVTRQTVKFTVIGAMAGLVLMAGILFLVYVFKDAMRTDSDWEQFCIPVLAKISSGESIEADCRLAANNLSAVIKALGLSSGVFTGDISGEDAKEILDAMNRALPDAKFVYAGNILTDPEAAQRLASANKVLLLGQKDSSMRGNVQKELTLLKAWNKDIAGAVILE